MSAFCPIFCSDNRRRDLVLATANLNGIDYVEVMGAAGCGTRLAVTFLKDAHQTGPDAQQASSSPATPAFRSPALSRRRATIL